MYIFLMTAVIFMTFGFTPGNSPGGNEWKAPAETDKIINPLKGNASATEEGKKLFMQMCSICHGDKGKGDGIGGLTLIPKPGNFTAPKMQAQSDGALYWKMTVGRPPMASYASIITEKQRWQLVNYLRTFNPVKK